MKQYTTITFLLLCVTSAVTAQTPTLTKLEVFPPDLNLSTARDRQSFVVQATTTDGITRDLTSEARLNLGNTALVKVDRDSITPVADGTTELSVEFAGQTVKVPVQVKDAAIDPPISFRLDVMPVFTKSGCNTG